MRLIFASKLCVVVLCDGASVPCPPPALLEALARKSVSLQSGGPDALAFPPSTEPAAPIPLPLTHDPAESRFSYVWFHAQSDPPLGADAMKLRAAGGETGAEKLFVLRLKKGDGGGRVAAAVYKVTRVVRTTSAGAWPMLLEPASPVHCCSSRLFETAFFICRPNLLTCRAEALFGRSTLSR